MNELANSLDGKEIEIHAQMLAEARSQDVVLNLKVEAVNATAGTDFEIISSSNTIVIPAGKFTSEEGFKIKTINNGISNGEDRSITVSISSVSDPSINIGRGLNNPTNSFATIEIVDDECSDDLTLFNNAEWEFAGSNTVYYSEYSGGFTTAIRGDQMTISGDIANYDVGITVTTNLIPNPDAPTTGTIEFVDSSSIGNDGTYDYPVGA